CVRRGRAGARVLATQQCSSLILLPLLWHKRSEIARQAADLARFPARHHAGGRDVDGLAASRGAARVRSAGGSWPHGVFLTGKPLQFVPPVCDHEKEAIPAPPPVASPHRACREVRVPRREEIMVESV